MQKTITKEMEDQFIKDAEAALEAPRSENKIRITTMIDGDVKDALVARAKEEGHGKYQATLNSILRRELLSETGSKNLEIRNIIREEMGNVIKQLKEA